MDPDLLIICIAIVTACIGTPIARALARRVERRRELPIPSGDITQRLETLQQSVEAIAVEVERISEGQRFTTKLLSDRSKAPDQPG